MRGRRPSASRSAARICLPLALTGVLLLPPLAGCTTAGHQRTVLRETQKLYTQHMRWSDYEKAALFVAPEEREAFLERTDQLGHLRIIDYRVRLMDIEDEVLSATALVSYSAYRRASPVAITIRERQQWLREEGTGKWHVKSSFEEGKYNAERRF